MASKFLNEQPLEHISSNGTKFISDRCDLRNGVRVLRPEGLSDEQYCADSVEFGAYHAYAIHGHLNGCPGYDAVKYTVELM